MTETKLILVEGLPGSGKTSTALFVASWLDQHGLKTAVYLEGDLNHPADFESVAYLDRQEYAALKAQFPAEAPFLENHLIRQGDDHFFRYRHLEQNFPGLSSNLVTALAAYEIYELPVATYRRLLQSRWQRFADDAAQEATTYIFECCFIQNPLTMMMGRHNETAESTQNFILELADIIQPLAPRWLYLKPEGVRPTLGKIAQERSKEWLNYVIAYHTQQGHGKAQGWQGFDGLVHFYEMRLDVELSLLPKLPFSGLLVPHTNWSENQARIGGFLGQTFPA